MSERLEKIRKMIDEQKEHVDPHTKEVYHEEYDNIAFKLSFDGHVDWLIKELKNEKKSNKQMQDAYSKLMDSYIKLQQTTFDICNDGDNDE